MGDLIKEFFSHKPYSSYLQCFAVLKKEFVIILKWTIKSFKYIFSSFFKCCFYHASFLILKIFFLSIFLIKFLQYVFSYFINLLLTLLIFFLNILVEFLLCVFSYFINLLVKNSSCCIKRFSKLSLLEVFKVFK